MDTPESRAAHGPVVPDYVGANVSQIVPNCLLQPPGRRPPWFVPELAEARSILLLVVDGLGYEQMLRHQRLLPNMSSFGVTPLTTVAPSTTATALTSITTGATPLEHGIVGYRMVMDGTVMNTLRWGSDRADLRKSFPPADIQPIRPFAGMSVPVLSRRDLEATAFTQAHLRGSTARGWRVMSGIIAQTRELFASGEPFVYAYYDGLDKVAHEYGFGPFYEAELSAIDWLVGALLDALPAGTTVAITADHGQVFVGSRTISLPSELLEQIHLQSGEGRFRWLHCRRGRLDGVRELAEEVFGNVAWVRTRDEVLDEGWFGTRGTSAQYEESIRRLGDVALVPFADVSFDDPTDTGSFALQCRHGSLTHEEMMVPLLAHTIS